MGWHMCRGCGKRVCAMGMYQRLALTTWCKNVDRSSDNQGMLSIEQAEWFRKCEDDAKGV